MSATGKPAFHRNEKCQEQMPGLHQEGKRNHHSSLTLFISTEPPDPVPPTFFSLRLFLMERFIRWHHLKLPDIINCSIRRGAIALALALGEEIRDGELSEFPDDEPSEDEDSFRLFKDSKQIIAEEYIRAEDAECTTTNLGRN
ncbi:hypothetical protein C0J52_20199 [Blattella germanica]|nr:hypothetical protein C0J52_20199 [Blattella germanica]